MTKDGTLRRRRRRAAVAGVRSPGATAPALVLLLATAAAAAPCGGKCTLAVSAADDLQQAIARAPADRRAVVCLGAGEFRLRGFVAIDRDDVTLRGAGSATVLRLDEGVESPIIVVGDYAHATPRAITANVTIENLRIVGGGHGGSEFDPAHPYLTNSAVVVRAGRNVRIRDLHLTACRSACILTERGTRGVSIEHNRIGNAVWDGISLNRTWKARVLRNTIRRDTAAGITAEHLESSLIAANVLRENRTHGIYLSDSARNSIRRNRFVRNVLSGVFLTCAVRRREPPVRCWRDSMSRDNVFERNAFLDNRIAFMVAADRAADCRSRSFVPNRSRDDRFRGNARVAPDAARHGPCLRLLTKFAVGGG